MSMTLPTDTLLHRLRDAGAAQRDAVGWHYIEVLDRRVRTHRGQTQALLLAKLQEALTDLQTRLSTSDAPLAIKPGLPTPSALALLLQDMTPAASRPPGAAAGAWRESPRTGQFRRQLRKISVQKQVSQAIASAPQNAGPMNSHMLVVRALGLMHDISPDYLNRFMTHLDTLLCLEASGAARQLPGKARPKARSRKP